MHCTLSEILAEYHFAHEYYFLRLRSMMVIVVSILSHFPMLHFTPHDVSDQALPAVTFSHRCDYDSM